MSDTTPDKPFIPSDAYPFTTQRIDELYVWIATHENGGEGIMSADLPTPHGPRHVPLVTSRPRVAEVMRAKAEEIQELSRTQNGVDVAIALVTYRRVP